ncbi:T9SS type A sorting domain-containing protein [Aurantibacillus circumpalustris]|uniref:T9SS type A sorting domain-containing protein n=1 Tax=Aurantibacillus circumpalustris TaxID=3036359 RepID=UPI00295B94A7|nr:T9SS type A sorting domain-containing protein [Aurantibacillus circumpalustris]
MRVIYSFLLSICLGITVFAQQTVKLNINHKLNSQPFLTTLTATNNLGNTFKTNRLEYYISKITIIHDGAQTTNATGVYALVNAASLTSIDLGSYTTITNVEGITFGIGVNTPENNQDPALWPSTHPLSPKNPSMHWGWASGYFFIAMGGGAGASTNNPYELHALGNINYHTQTVTVSSTLIGGEKIISLDANYEEALKNINVNNGLVLHGETDECVTICNNFRDYVFAAAQTTMNTVGIKENSVAKNNVVLYPNPNTNGVFHFNSFESLNTTTHLKIIDVSGRIILEKSVSELGRNQIELKNKGVYFVSLLNQNEIIVTQKVIVL